MTQQVKGIYDVREERLKKYSEAILKLSREFTDWSIEQIPREENAEADALAKLVSSLIGEGQEVVHHTQLVSAIEAGDDVSRELSWIIPIMEYIIDSKLSKDLGQSRRIKKQASRFVVMGGSLYRRSFSGILLKCVAGEEAEYVLREIHEGCCGNHGGSFMLVRRALLAGFWWPTISDDSARVARTCEGCQKHANFICSPASSMKPVRASCPFDQWGLDIVGSFSIARSQKKFLLVAVDYLSK